MFFTLTSLHDIWTWKRKTFLALWVYIYIVRKHNFLRRAPKVELLKMPPRSPGEQNMAYRRTTTTMAASRLSWLPSWLDSFGMGIAHDKKFSINRSYARLWTRHQRFTANNSANLWPIKLTTSSFQCNIRVKQTLFLKHFHGNMHLFGNDNTKTIVFTWDVVVSMGPPFTGGFCDFFTTSFDITIRRLSFF